MIAVHLSPHSIMWRLQQPAGVAEDSTPPQQAACANLAIIFETLDCRAAAYTSYTTDRTATPRGAQAWRPETFILRPVGPKSQGLWALCTQARGSACYRFPVARQTAPCPENRPVILGTGAQPLMASQACCGFL